MSGTTENIFQAIKDFVCDLNSEFGETNKPLSLYNTLLSKTTLSHTIHISKHVDLFRDFINSNKDVLTNTDLSLLSKPKLEYSEKVYINFEDIIPSCGQDTKKALLKHLANINALLNPTEDAMQLIKSVCGTSDSDYDFITDIISTVTENIDTENISDPMTTAMSLLSSGKLTKIFDDMRTKFTEGSLDPAQLLKKVSKIYSEVSQGEADLPDISTLISSCTSQMPKM